MSRRDSTTVRHRHWWPALVIIGAACAFCWPVFAGRIMLPADMCLLMLPWRELRAAFPEFHRPHNPMFDPIQQYLPWRIYAVESLRAGTIPLWNPYAFCGTPFLANLQSTVLYPLNLIFLAVGARHGFGISAIIHLSLGGLFMFAFLRSLALGRAAALLGALVLMFGGFTVTWLEFPTLSLWVFMWLPALLLCYERAVCRPRSVWPALCALAVALQFLGGHLQISAYVLIAFGLYAVVRAAGRGGRPRGRATALCLAALPIALGLAAAAAQVLPTLELARYSGRVAHGAPAALRTAFPLSHFILYLVPNFFGNPVDYNYWGNFRDETALNFFETACYVGVTPLFLALGALRRWRSPGVGYFASLTAFALLAAVGSPLYLALYYLAPGFRELAGLGRVLCLAAFGLAGLAACGLEALLTQKKPERVGRWLGAGAIAVAAIAIAVAAFRPYLQALPASLRFDVYLARQVGTALAFVALGVGLIALRASMRLSARLFAWAAIALVALDLGNAGVRFNPFVDPRMAYPETEATRWLAEGAGHQRVTSLASDGLDWMPHNSPMVFGLRDIHGSDSLRLRRSFDLVAGPHLDQAGYPPPDSPLLDALGVRYLMTRRDVGGKWRQVRGGSAPIFENDRALPRARLVYRYRVGSDDDARALLESPGLAAREAVIHSEGVEISPGAASGWTLDPQSEVRFLRDAPTEVVLDVETASPALLVLSDSYDPGWRARIYQSEAKLLRANLAFRAVEIPPGRHRVTFRYEPASFRVGLFISLAAVSVIAAWVTVVALSAKTG